MATVKQLQAELRGRGASVRGRKADLIERLESYKRNENFQDDVDVPEPVSIKWPVGGFKTLMPSHKESVPLILDGHVSSYFHYRMASDRLLNKDLKATSKGKALLESRRVRTASFKSEENATYVTSIVAAMMKKKGSYSVRLHLQTDGQVVNSDCECPAGAGPHSTCKHVAAVLYMLQQFVTTGEMLLQGSCTEKLQTFHQPRKQYQGSPVKVQHIPSKRKSTVNLADPRPLKFRKLAGYNDFVRNNVINYCSRTSHDLAMRYIYPKADLQAAVHDHAYLERSFTEYWVDKGLQVTEDEVTDIEKTTRDQAKSNKWFEHREWRIGASMQGEICHATDRWDKIKLCTRLMNPPQLTTSAVLHGRAYEEDAREKFANVAGLKVQKCGLHVCLEHPFLAATPDGLVGKFQVLEIKCPYSGRNSLIAPGKLFPYLKYDEGELKLKNTHKYYDQVQAQMAITNRKQAYFVVYTFIDFKNYQNQI